MIVQKVNEALAAAIQNKSNDASLLKMLTAQFQIAARSRKSGDTVTDDKATVIIKRMIEGIKRDQDLSGNPQDEMIERKIKLLESFL